MIGGLLAKTIRETWLATLLFGAALMVEWAALTHILPQVLPGLDNVLFDMPFVKNIMTAMLGTELGDGITAQMMQSFLWVHPAVLTTIWAHEIVFCTRFPAGEIDRGTIDLLLGLPVSRRAVYLCETVLWLSSGALILLLGLAGYALSAHRMPTEMQPDWQGVVLVVINLFCVYVAVGGLAFLVSSCSNRKGRAMAVVFAIVLASFLLNFLAQFWEPAKNISFLSVMNYYRPAEILTAGQVAVGDLVALLVTGGCAWLVGGEIVARRSVCTL